MTAEIKQYMRGALFARLPFFTPEEKCEEKWACRMNGFYESLLCEAEKYAGDASFPAARDTVPSPTAPLKNAAARRTECASG